ncbi:MAG TPA: S-layer homology domain-containing protein [Candidatus Evtepia faecigallinarum]|nr:S-layer homology domain-containing protein [Candidatus Evtepia faecigallinarum]
MLKRTPALLFSLLLALTLCVPALAAEGDEGKMVIYDDAGYAYTLSQPYVSEQVVQKGDKTVTEYTLLPNTTVTAPDGFLFKTWFGECISFPDAGGGGDLAEPLNAIVPDDDWWHEYLTDQGTWLYVRVPMVIPFDDVTDSDYFCKPVLWAVEEGITNGTSETTFSPANPCTQGQIVTFLWRAAGSPEPVGENPYTNPAVTEGTYFYDALLWAYEAGLVVDDGLDPTAGCSRSDVVLYMWRYAGCPEAPAVTFEDVPADAEYAPAVAWAVEAGVTNGTTATTFSPDKVCSRGEIVTFLYRGFYLQ